MNIGKIVRKYRVVSEISGPMLAKQMEVTPSTLYRFEKGENILSKEYLKIMNWLTSDSENGKGGKK